MSNHEMVGEIVSQDTVGGVFETLAPDGSGRFVNAIRYIQRLICPWCIHIAVDGTETKRVVEKQLILYEE